MHEVSEKYRQLWAAGARTETSLVIGDSGRLVDQSGDRIIVGGVSILVDSGGPEGGYGSDRLISLECTRDVFADKGPTPGACVAAEIDIEMLRPLGSIPRMARLAPYVRLTDGVSASEWIPKGVYYIDTRENSKDSAIETLKIHGYDGMLKAEMPYPASKLTWPAKDVQVVAEIASAMGVGVDPRTWAAMNRGYAVPYLTEYTCREILGQIAAAYGGCFVMSDTGDLLLITLAGLPKETRLLIDHSGDYIVVGGDRIRV